MSWDVVAFKATNSNFNMVDDNECEKDENIKIQRSTAGIYM